MSRWPLPAELAFSRRHRFVGRAAELESLRTAWARTESGGASVVLVRGEAGVGKTTLVAELAEHAQGLVLYGRCDEGVALPYQPFVEALRRFVAHATDAELCRIPRSSAAELVQWLPGLDDRIAGLSEPMRAGPEATRYLLLRAMRDAVHVAGAIGTTLLILDDLHWASKPTLDMLRFVLTPTPPPHVLIVGLHRDTDAQASADLVDLFAQLRTNNVHAIQLTLEGLSTDELRELAATYRAGERLRADEETARALRARTGGNPFFATEVLELLAESVPEEPDLEAIGVPESVRDVVEQRLDRLGDGVNEVLEVAAVMSATFDLRILEHVLGASDDVLERVELAIRSGLVTELTSGEMQFAHALVRDTVRARLGASRLLRLHLAIGESLASQAVDAPVQVVAHHLCNAAPLGDASHAARWALRAARVLLSSFGAEAAVEHATAGLRVLDLARAGEHALRADLHLALAEARFRLADFAGRKEAAAAAAEAARAAGGRDQLALAAFWFGHYGEVGNLDEEVVSLCEEALAKLTPGDHGLRAAVLNTLSANRALAGDTLAAIPGAAEAVAEARAAGDPVLLHETLVTQYTSLTGSPASAERLAIAEEIISHAAATHDGPGLAHGHRLRAIARLIRGDRVGFASDHAALTRFGTELNDHFMLAVAAQWQAMDALLSGRFDEVESLGVEALALSNNEPNFFNAYAAQLFWLHYEQGRLADFLPLLEDSAEQNPGIVAFRCALAMSYATIGDERARTLLHEICAAGTDAIPFDWIRTIALAQLIEAAAVLDDASYVDELRTALEPYSGELIVVATGTQCAGAVDRFLGMAAIVQRDFDGATAYLDAAYRLERKIDAPPLWARTDGWRRRLESAARQQH